MRFSKFQGLPPKASAENLLKKSSFIWPLGAFAGAETRTNIRPGTQGPPQPRPVHLPAPCTAGSEEVTRPPLRPAPSPAVAPRPLMGRQQAASLPATQGRDSLLKGAKRTRNATRGQFQQGHGGRPACPTGAWCPSWNLGGRRAPGVPTCRRADTHVCGFSAGKTCGSPDPRRAPRPGAGGARGLTAATTLPHGPKPRWGRASGQCPRGLPRSLPGGRPPLPCTHGAGSSVCFGVTAQHPRDMRAGRAWLPHGHLSGASWESATHVSLACPKRRRSGGRRGSAGTTPPAEHASAGFAPGGPLRVRSHQPRQARAVAGPLVTATFLDGMRTWSPRRPACTSGVAGIRKALHLWPPTAGEALAPLQP